MNAFAHPISSVLNGIITGAPWAQGARESQRPAPQESPQVAAANDDIVITLAPDIPGGFDASGIVRTRSGETYHEVQPSEDLLRRLREAGL